MNCMYMILKTKKWLALGQPFLLLFFVYKFSFELGIQNGLFGIKSSISRQHVADCHPDEQELHGIKSKEFEADNQG